MDTYQEVIESIRESRRRMSEKCNHDSGRYIAYLQSFNAKYPKQVESFQKLRDSVPTEDPISSSE
jgi:hypothetical protein